MVIGIGCDIIEIARISRALAKDAFIKKVFTPKEEAYCRERNTQAVSSFAVRFAAKEAVLKALGTGLRGGSWREIEVVSDALGRPSIELGGFYGQLARTLGIKNIHVSLSHGRESALAFVVLEDGK